LPGNILKVDCFLNHCLDVEFLMGVGREISELFKDRHISKILTIETSGIPIAFAAGHYMNVPVVFAKKKKTGNIADNFYHTQVASYTHGNTYDVIVSKEFINGDDSILLIDDFLAKGNALKGLIDIISQAGATLAGCAIAIEKGFQGGGDELRNMGIRVESLAIIEEMSDNTLRFR